MAQYTPSSGDYCRPHKSPWGNFPTRGFQPLSTTAALNAGMLVQTPAASGSSDANRILAVKTNGSMNAFNIAGIVAEPVNVFTSSNTTQNAVSVWEACPFVEFKAVTKGAALGSSCVGLRRALGWDSTLNIVYVDLTASTATDWRVVVTGVMPDLTRQVEGDSGGYCAFRFLTSLGEQIGSTTIQSSNPLLAFWS